MAAAPEIIGRPETFRLKFSGASPAMPAPFQRVKFPLRGREVGFPEGDQRREGTSAQS